MRKTMLSLTLCLTGLLASCGGNTAETPAPALNAQAATVPGPGTDPVAPVDSLEGSGVSPANTFAEMTTASPNLVQLAQTYPLERAQDRQWYIDYFGLVYSHSGYSDPTSNFASQWVDFYRVTRPVSDFQWSITKAYWKQQLPTRLDLQDPANKQSAYIAYKIFDMDWGNGVQGIYPVLKPDWKTAR
ncbi:hypothetical protein DVJ83_17970 (plasmid) [Deinococcus wulumuqiensis]|uniref:Lipoprotein n=1 Tax=Deinococcus wulumuqiensis TaxID=980427 RepID=A0A345IMR3_9DEIO|nr:hypothetical protein [Deinococcus wulumuqiensis]AXH00986.1 hypothetical protein DVJ83_17970 [Deinococcus wulumuqiensis]